MKSALAPRTAHLQESHLSRWRALSWVCGFSTVAFGVAYIGAEILFIEKPSDPLFVAIIIANAFIAIRFGFHFEKRLFDLLSAFNATEGEAAEAIDPKTAVHNIFDHRLALPTAILFAGFIAGWVYALSPWTLEGTPHHAAILNSLLAAFLFCGNLIIGFGFYCIVRFWLLAARRIEAVDLLIFNPTRPDIAIYQDIIRQIVILVAVIATLAVVSLPLSQIDLGVTTLLFSLTSLSVVIATYLIPMLPLTRKFQETKHKEMHRVETRMDAIYEHMMETDDPSTHRDKLEALIALRDQVKAVKTLPPGGEFSIVTAVSVSFVTFLPSILDWLPRLASL